MDILETTIGRLFYAMTGIDVDTLDRVRFVRYSYT